MKNLSLHQQLSQWTTSCNKREVTYDLEEKLGIFFGLAKENEKKVDVFTFTYVVNDTVVAGFLVAPKNIKTKLSTIIYNRGGTSNYGLVPVGRLFTHLANLAQNNYIVIGSQYPGNDLSEGFDERGGQSDINSVLRLHDFIKKLSVADEERIGMYGQSRGGMMTYLCMKQVDWIKAAITVGGEANLYRSIHYRPEMAELYQKHFGNNNQEKDRRSAVKWANKLHKTTPLCLLHGEADDKVDVRDALELANKLIDADHPLSLYILEGGDHGLRNLYRRRDVIVYEWFDAHLKGSR